MFSKGITILFTVQYSNIFYSKTILRWATDVIKWNIDRIEMGVIIYFYIILYLKKQQKLFIMRFSLSL